MHHHVDPIAEIGGIAQARHGSGYVGHENASDQ